MVFVGTGVGLASLARLRTGSIPLGAGPGATVAIVVALGAWNVLHQPPLVAPDGGWPAAVVAGDRVLRSLPPGPTEIVSLPVAKGPDAVRFPLVRAGAALPTLVAPAAPPAPDAVARIVLCDDLFRSAIGAACGGPAEDSVAGPLGLTVADRFEAAPGRWISVYLPG
jgi:hypothetical protein